jgi:hypothetical protein
MFSLIHNFFKNFFTVTEAEKRRLQDAFRRLSASSGHVSRQVFIKEVVGDALPALLAEQIYRYLLLLWQYQFFSFKLGDTK